MCKCNMMASAGDMSSRLWECEEHGKTGMMGTMSVISKHTSKHGCTSDESWDAAMALMKIKRSQAERANKIYYCEDHFNRDFTESI